jgi:stress response protein SCP2
MTRLSKGQNTPLTASSVRAVIGWQPGPGVPDVDISALLLGPGRKVRSDADFVFYNQPTHPSGAVRHEGKRSAAGIQEDSVRIDIPAVPADVERILIGASADGGPFGKAPGLHLRVLDGASNAELARFDITDASTETAYLFGEVYRRGAEWKLRAVGQGYDSGLRGFAMDFGVSVDEPTPAPQPPAVRATPAPQPPAAPYAPPTAPPAAPYAPPAAPYPPPTAPPAAPYPPPTAPPAAPYPPPTAPPAAPYPPPTAPYAPPAVPYPPPTAPPVAPPTAAARPSTGGPAPSGAPVNLAKQRKLIDMEKRAAQQAPQLLSLTKQAAVSLEKHGLSDHTARVALCLDISASMTSLYRSGKIQALAERVLALGLRFDDNEMVDVFLFGANAHEVGELGMHNFAAFLDSALRQHPLEGGTYYGKAIKLIRQNYFGSPGPRNQPVHAQQPVYVMFITDGATFDESATQEQLIFSAFEPIFWQFMAIGESDLAVDSGGSGGGGGRPGGGPRGGPSGGPGGGPGGRAKKKGFFARLTQSDFTFLENLDNLPGRFIDNANFFAVTDPANIPDADLFELMMAEYPGWLQLARQAKMLP